MYNLLSRNKSKSITEVMLFYNLEGIIILLTLKKQDKNKKYHLK